MLAKMREAADRDEGIGTMRICVLRIAMEHAWSGQGTVELCTLMKIAHARTINRPLFLVDFINATFKGRQASRFEVISDGRLYQMKGETNEGNIRGFVELSTIGNERKHDEVRMNSLEYLLL